MTINYQSSEQKHWYGKNVHLIANPLANSMLTELCKPNVVQPRVNDLVVFLYELLALEALNTLCAQKEIITETRMTAMHPEQKLHSWIVDPQQKMVFVNLARAGTLPTHVMYHLANRLVNPHGVRQDHIMAARATSADGSVTGTDLSAAKIGGPIEDSLVFFPDPMGATGGTLVEILNHYKENVEGQAKEFVAIHLIITPEYLRNLQENHPDCHIFALRLDRGLSAPEILKTELGEMWEQERGLNDSHYIVPGAGGLGEVLNNSYV